MVTIEQTFGVILTSLLLCKIPDVCAAHEDESLFKRLAVGRKRPTVIDEYPYQVSIQNLRNGTWYHSCGGSIIDAMWIVTAAHCIKNDMRYSTKWRVAAGMTNKTSPLYTRQISEAIKHEQFKDFGDDHQNLPNDIAVLKLKDDMPIDGSRTESITMAEDQNFENTTCIISGWGRTNDGFPDKIHHVGVDIISNVDCNKWLADTITKSHMCAFDPENKRGDACTLDSGGPLTCYADSIPTLAGVISWGDSLCSGGFPSVYSRISFFRDWITSKTEFD